MILKYKLKNGSWRFIGLTDFVVGKVDISEVYNKYLDKETGKLNPKDESGFPRFELKNLFEQAAYYKLEFNDTYDILYNNEIINKYMHYGVISYNNDKCLVLYDEAYLMSDEGKTIEKLM